MTTQNALEIIAEVEDAFFTIRSLSAVLEVDCCGGDEELIEKWGKISSCNVVSNIARIIQGISQKQSDPLWDLRTMIRDMGKEASS